MDKKRTFRDLIAWQKAVDLAKLVYEATRQLPPDERYGLTSQMRRAAVSVASNIAEGNARQTLRDYINFLSVARGSLAELETQFIISAELGLLRTTDELEAALAETGRVLQGLIAALQEKRRRNEVLKD